MKALRTLAVVVLLGAICILVVAPLLIKFLAFRRMTPEQVTAYDNWQNRKITVAAEIRKEQPPRPASKPTPEKTEQPSPSSITIPAIRGLKPAPFAPATVTAAEAYRQAWEKYKNAALEVTTRHLPRSGAIHGNLDFAAVNRDLAPLAPLIKAFETLVAQPDYEINAGTAGQMWTIDPGNTNSGMAQSVNFPMPNFLAVQTASKLLCLKSLSQANAGNSEQALQTAANVVRAGRGSNCDILISQLIGVAIASMGTRAWGEAATSCNDPQLLRRTLKRQDEMAREQIYLTSADQVQIADGLGQLRELNRRGMDVSVDGLTQRQIGAAQFDAQARYYEKFLLPQVANDPEKAALAKFAIKNAETQATIFGHAPYNAVGILVWAGSAVVTPYLYAIATPNFLEASTRADASRTRFELLQLQTAQRVWTLEHPGQTATIADLVPSLLEETPKDCFAKDKSDIKRATEWYSVGPDGIDQKGAIVYDPTNGTKSAGDLLLGQ